MKKAIARRYPALTYRDMRYFLFGWFVNNAGTQMQIVAINWQLYELTRSPFSLALLGAARILPVFVFSLIGGTIADAHNRKKILIVSQIAQGIITLILTILVLMGLATPMVLYSVTAILIAIYCVDGPARSAFVPRLVAKEHYGNAVALNIMGYNISTVAGPAIAGFLIAYAGVGAVYAANAISFFTMFWAVAKIRAGGQIEGVPPKASFSAIGEGVKFVFGKTILWSTMLLDFFSTLFAEATILLPIFAKDILHVGPQYLGLLYAAPFIGATVSGLVSSHIGKRMHTGKILFHAVIMYALGTILFGISTNYVLSFFALTIVGFGDGISSIIRNIVRQLATPDYIRGRMISINMIFYTGGPRLGEIEAGILAGLLGGPITVVIGGIGTILVVSIMSLTIPTLRNYKE